MGVCMNDEQYHLLHSLSWVPEAKMEDEHGHGAGNRNKKGQQSTSKKRSEVATKKDTVRLTESDANYPKDVPRELREVMDQGDRPKSVFKVRELIVLDKVVEEDLIRLLDKGPVAISVANHIEFGKFKGDGIYEGPKRNIADIGFHMLLCTGYGTLDGVHYWEVQNSAGTDWGNEGFGKIIRQTSRAKGKPSLTKYVVYPVLLDAYTDEE